ncbi:MAG: AAA family ATPase [Chitinophagaceae bacterium]
MGYKKIIINNFRRIKSLALENTARVNLLLGKNNCGKSSILEAIFLITGINNPQLILNIDSLRNLTHTEEGDFSFPFYNLDYNFHPKIEADGLAREKAYKMEILPKMIMNEVIVPSKDKSNQPISESITSTHTNPLKAINGLEIKCEMKEEGKRKRTYSIHE